MQQRHPIFVRYTRSWLHEVTGFSLNYLCRIVTGRAPLTCSFVERVCHSLGQSEEELFLPGRASCLQPGHCATNVFGQWIEDKCKARNLSFRQFAIKVGVSHQTIAGHINGTSPSIESIKKIARSFSGNDTQRLALEDKLFALAGYREQPEELNDQNYLKIITLLSPQHQHALETLVREFAEIEGIK